MSNNPQKMRHVRGLIVFRCPENNNGNQTDFEYLLLKKPQENDWSPPKGKKDDQWEPEMATATRETKEETGLIEGQDYKVLDSCRIYFKYNSPSRPGILKKVTLWPARLVTFSKDIQISEEHEEFKWFKMNDALSTVKKEYKNAFKKAVEFLATR